MPSSPLAAQDTIRAAFEDLKSAVTANDSRRFASSTLEDVRNAALEVERQLVARKSFCNMGRLYKVFSGLQHYSKAIEVVCNGTPYIPWIWGPMILIMQVASSL